MTAPLFTSPWFRPLDSSGAIMPGAKLVFYASETTDPEDVYADGQLGTSLGNEIEADADGRFAPFYLDPTILYRVQLYSAAGVLQPDGDVDPLIPSPGGWIGETRLHHGTLANIPAGWQHADGTNGTADSRDRFPVGAGSTYAVGAAGGAASASGTTAAAGGHDHGGTTDDFTLTVAEMPAHAHGQGSRGSNASSNGSGDSDFVAAFPGNGGGDTESVGDGDPHAHDIDAVADHTHSISSIATIPPYRGYYFIEFVGA